MVGNQASIRSKDELAELLDEFGWFEDGYCLVLTPPPTAAGTPPDRVDLVLRDAGTGGLRPGDVRTYRALKLASTDVEDWSFQGDKFFHSPQHCTEGIELVEARDSFGVTIDAPSIARLLARSFAFERLPEVTELVEPWTSGRELHVNAASGQLPTPGDWIDALAREGLVAAWRLYGDDPAALSRVPEDDYNGWFLQRPERTSDGHGGVMFTASDDGRRLVMSLQRWEADDELWDAIRRAAARILREATFTSGNSTFLATEWLAHLSQERG
jgi:hypothetical protein